MAETIILFFVAQSILPLLLSVFYYVTKPVPGSRWRQFSRAWLSTPIGPVLVAQMVSMIVLLSYILLVRFTGGFPGREVVAIILYALLQAGFWAFFIVLRRTQIQTTRKKE